MISLRKLEIKGKVAFEGFVQHGVSLINQKVHDIRTKNIETLNQITLQEHIESNLG